MEVLKTEISGESKKFVPNLVLDVLFDIILGLIRNPCFALQSEVCFGKSVVNWNCSETEGFCIIQVYWLRFTNNLKRVLPSTQSFNIIKNKLL